jgi:hypothetical protein
MRPEVAVASEQERPHRAGEPIMDLCRACKTVRGHTVVAVDPEGRALRVVCDYCRSEHNYRGGGEYGAERHAATESGSAAAAPAPAGEGTGAAMATSGSEVGLERLLRRVLREELGLTPGAPAEKWRGGELVLRPGRPGTQEKRWPLDAFFHKIVMIRNRLRTLEQQVNAAELPEDAKLRLQAYVTACYGSLTSFNALFAEEADRFRGAGGED